MHIAVFGAGAFGGWTALSLLRRGASVSLIDAWGAGNVRASSGGSTRVMRATYGGHAIYTDMAARALRLWKEYDAAWKGGLLHQTGALWLFGKDASFGTASADTLHRAGIALDEIPVRDAARRFPQVSFDDVARVMMEPEAGYLLAARACAHVARRFVEEGGELRQAAALSPAAIDDSGVRLNDGTHVQADAFVFACGPWLGTLFPRVIGEAIAPTRQEVYYFGTPAGDARFESPALPVWLDCADRFMYGIPGDDGQGFKVADDTPGPPLDPTCGERAVTPDAVERVRAYLARRFPAMAGAPLVRAEICQYEATPDSHFIVDRHPHDSRVWIAGGGSGHAFKMGPAIGQLIASQVLGDQAPDPRFGLARFASIPAGGWQAKWA